MKNNWQIKKLGDVCDFHNGLWKGKEPPYIEVGVIRNTNFTKDGELDDVDIAYLDVEKKQFEKRKLFYGDIVLEKSGGGPKQPVGRVIVFDKKEGDFSFSNFTSVIRIKRKDQVDFKYLHKYLFFSYISGVTETMQSHSTGIRNLDFKLYKEIKIPLPPFPEQHRIVKILDEVFEKIAKAKENAQKNLQNARELFESYLHGVDADKESVGSLVNIATGKLDVNAAKEDGKYPFFTCAREIYAIDKYAFDCEAILLAGNNAVGDFNVKHYKGKFNAYQRTYVITVNNENRVLYRYLYFQMLKSLKEFKQKSVGVGTKFLKLGMIKEMRIVLPSIKDQTSIVTKLDILLTETKKLEAIYQQKTVDLEELKKSMLQKAFNGKLAGACS
jgi:type I restriction enzyme S subunit